MIIKRSRALERIKFGIIYYFQTMYQELQIYALSSSWKENKIELLEQETEKKFDIPNIEDLKELFRAD